MTESRHRTNCDGPLSCAGEGQAAPDAITYARKARISLGATRRRTKQEDAMRGPWRRLKSQFSHPSNRIIRVTLFLKPRNHARRCRAYMFHAALASLPWRVAGESSDWGRSLPPVFLETVNPAHAVRCSQSVVVSVSVAGMERNSGAFAGWQKGFAGS